MLGFQATNLAAVPGISHRFFGRRGGTSPKPWRGLNTAFNLGDSPARVQENLARIRFQLGVKRNALLAPRQVHGAAVLRVKAGADPDEVAAMEADAIWTTDKDLAVGVRTADCVPILLAFDDGSAVGAAHAGWRGATGGVVQAVVSAMCTESGLSADRLVASVGPCIGQDAFEVGPEVVEAAAQTASVDDLVRRGEGDRLHLDLGGLVERLLRESGLENVECLDLCTATDLNRFYSHRAEDGRTGRQISALAITQPPELA